MECPFCAETVKDEAIVCKHCSRDLRIVRPVILEIQEIVEELDTLSRKLDRANARLERIHHPGRSTATIFAIYILPPVILLVAAHVIVTIMLDVSPLYLRLASLVIPLPFGLAIYALHKIGFRGALICGLVVGALSVAAMLTVTGLHDHVPIVPESGRDWREVVEYAASILLAFVTGNILFGLIVTILPSTMAQGGKPNAAAYRVALMLGSHVGEEQLRRRSRIIQDLWRTVGPLGGVLVTAGGSIYAGLKGVLGN